MNHLLLEIGTEEIPAGYIAPALAALSSTLIKRLEDARIGHGAAKTYGTPRRLAIMVDALSVRQSPLVTEAMGPPETVGYDATGSPTVAAAKFAEKVGVSVHHLKVKDTGKGRYLAAEIVEKGDTTLRVLKMILPEVILSLPFPKSMRWADLRLLFARPIHSICALLGDRVVSFSVGNIRSGRYTFGHRFMHPDKIKLSGPEQYLPMLESAMVIPDIGKRQNTMEASMKKAMEAASGQILPDPALMEEVANLIEYPAVVVGRFDEKFLELPREILITAMREHQRYFAVAGKDGRLLPFFVAVNNTLARDMELVIRGHERVLRARLEDARFFYQADRKTSVDDMAEKLKSVLFQAELGTMHDKTLRIETIALKLSSMIQLTPDIRQRIARAARLCKADLVSHVVGEFPKLQGIMGRIYASCAGEAGGVGMAVEEHYRPTASGGDLPSTLEGAVLSIADKIDTICGCFSAGLVPTGTSDPYALRRQGIGLIQIALDRSLSFSLSDLVDFSTALFTPKNGNEAGLVAKQVTAFLKGRLAHLLEESGVSKDGVAAVLAVAADDIPETWKKAHALQKLKTEPDFDAIAVAFKRVVNIIKKSKSDAAVGSKVNPVLFAHVSESELYAQFVVVREKVQKHLKAGNVETAFGEIASLRGPVDRFFEDVLVMDPDPSVRGNRFALLASISALFELLADFSRLAV